MPIKKADGQKTNKPGKNRKGYEHTIAHVKGACRANKYAIHLKGKKG